MVPVWIDGTHPSVADGMVTRRACANFGNRLASTLCCDHHLNVGIRNCSSFYVYYLYPTPTCPVAYCAETYPIIHTDPTFTGPTVSQHSFHFSCRVNYPQHDPDLRFEVQWTFDNGTDAGIPNMLLTDPDREAILPGTALSGHLDHLLRCRVRAWYANRQVEHKSPWRQSQEAHFVGFRVEPGHLELTDQSSVSKVRITSTLPIVCDHPFTAACCVSINLDVDGPKQTVVVTHPCTYKLCTKDWNPRTQTASLEVSVSAMKNQVVDGSRPMFLSFEKLEAAGGGGYLNVFSNYTLPEVPVNVKQSRPLKCSWTGDPHITGFSGERYHLFDAGDFTMYKTDTDDFEVQSRTYVCNRRVACQCGLLVKEHNDVIHINNCGDMKHAPVVETSQPLREGTVIERSNDGKHIMVYLPSGREVKMDVGSFYHNVYLTVPASDGTSGHGRGICGTPDGRADNEFTHSNGTVEKNPCAGKSICVPASFEESWRHNTTESLFHTLPPTVPTHTQVPHYCQCDDGVTGAPRINCSVAADLKHAQRCSPCGPTNNLPAFLAPQTGWSTTKREADFTRMDLPEPPHTVQRRIPDRWSLTWPTASGITEQEASVRCQTELKNAQLFSHCQTHSQLLQDTLDNCMLDVLFLDSYRMVEASVAAFTDGCQFELSRDIHNYDTDSQGNLVLKSHVTEVCTTACLRHGRCVHGTCVCNHGYSGSSCQLVAHQAPHLARVLSPSPCDARKESCRKVYMAAEGFENGDKFKCKIQEVLADGNLSSTALTEDAEFISGAKLACPLPARSLKTFAVSVTYDGRIYSNALHVTTFDSKCQSCEGTRCTLKANTCLINNLCYGDGDAKPGDATKVCKSSLNTSQWSEPLPSVMAAPTLTGPDDDFLFTCTFHTPSRETNARFEVTWLANGHPLAEATSVHTALSTTVQIARTALPAGDLRCRVRSFYLGEHTYSNYLTSNSKSVH
ncbi:von Willebrand factor D and EGF domain-containing protein-like [Babylonia areolata]|uniref:von Willebrand factor D and EGF domain-containing protein-like n=1 Tax=Babylonia areolata TaxID=304850 RepID=UPI003FD3508B